MNDRDQAIHDEYTAQLLEATMNMCGKAIISVQWKQNYSGYPIGVKFTFNDGSAAEFGAWADYADDLGMDVTTDGKEVSFDRMTDLPPHPPYVPAPPGSLERALQGLWAPALKSQLNDNTLLLARLEDELPEPPS